MVNNALSSFDCVNAISRTFLKLLPTLDDAGAALPVGVAWLICRITGIYRSRLITRIVMR